jgi:hypothetical protein
LKDSDEGRGSEDANVENGESKILALVALGNRGDEISTHVTVRDI